MYHYISITNRKYEWKTHRSQLFAYKINHFLRCHVIPARKETRGTHNCQVHCLHKLCISHKGEKKEISEVTVLFLFSVVFFFTGYKEDCGKLEQWTMSEADRSPQLILPTTSEFRPKSNRSLWISIFDLKQALTEQNKYIWPVMQLTG
jgi:hypothetical protein